MPCTCTPFIQLDGLAKHDGIRSHEPSLLQGGPRFPNHQPIISNNLSVIVKHVYKFYTVQHLRNWSKTRLLKQWKCRHFKVISGSCSCCSRSCCNVWPSKCLVDGQRDHTFDTTETVCMPNRSPPELAGELKDCGF